MTFAVAYTAEAADDIDEAINWLLPRMPSAVVDLLQTIRRSEVIFSEILLSTALSARRDLAIYAA
jgi:hypothetical protein